MYTLSDLSTLWAPFDCFYDPVPFDVTGTLDPGTYSLAVDAQSEGAAFCLDFGGGFACHDETGGGSYSVSFQVPPTLVPALSTAGFALLFACLVAVAVRRC